VVRGFRDQEYTPARTVFNIGSYDRGFFRWKHSVFGNNAPTFSGKSEDFERFTKMVRYWKSQSPLKPEKLAGKLILCQTDPHVLDIIMDLDEAEVESSNGLQTVMAALAEKYKIDSEDMASPAFDEFDAISRGMNETGAQFVLRFEIAYAKV